jgi:hypothetical protein
MPRFSPKTDSVFSKKKTFVLCNTHKTLNQSDFLRLPSIFLDRYPTACYASGQEKERLFIPNLKYIIKHFAGEHDR